MSDLGSRNIEALRAALAIERARVDVLQDGAMDLRAAVAALRAELTATQQQMATLQVRLHGHGPTERS